jgi:hypothetical protein
MDEQDIDLERYIDAAAQAVGLTVPEKYRADALAYLTMAAEIARPLLAFDLDQAIEPATRPGLPPAAPGTD